MEKLTIKQAKAYNEIIAKGLSLNSKLDMFFDDIQKLIRRDIGEEALKAVEKIVRPVTKDDSEKIISGFYDLNYEYQDFTKEDVEKAFELLFSNEEKQEIRNTSQEFFFTEYSDDYLLMAIANKYYKFFWSGNLEFYLNEIIFNLNESLEPKIKDLIKRS